MTRSHGEQASNDPNRGKAASDGPYTTLFQRPLARTFSPALAAHASPNVVTIAGLMVAGVAALCTVAGALVAGAAVIQLFGVLSCADGEVARLRGEETPSGDFLDTVVDRAAEGLMIVAVSISLARESALGTWAPWLGIALLSGMMLLVVTSEKYRSAYGRGYPKRSVEVLLSWVVSGSDARLLVLSVVLLVTGATGRAHVAAYGLSALAALGIVTAVSRVARVVRASCA